MDTSQRITPFYGYDVGYTLIRSPFYLPPSWLYLRTLHDQKQQYPSKSIYNTNSNGSPSSSSSFKLGSLSTDYMDLELLENYVMMELGLS